MDFRLGQIVLAGEPPRTWELVQGKGRASPSSATGSCPLARGWVTVSPQAAEGSSEARLPPAGWDGSGSAAEELQPRLSVEGSGGLRDSRATGQGR